MTRISKRLREAALILAWGDGHEVRDFDDLTDWYQKNCIDMAREVLADIDNMIRDNQ